VRRFDSGVQAYGLLTIAKEPTAKERIDYLVRRRFPHSYLLKIPPSISLSIREPPPDTRDLRVAVEAFTKS